MTQGVAKKPSEYPWRVVTTTTGGIISGHDTEDAAEQKAKLANKIAEELNITARYEVKEKP